jgi:uncharacterized membrane-anchored protein
MLRREQLPSSASEMGGHRWLRLDRKGRSMTSVVGWIIITLTFASISMGLLYPCYRFARRSYPESRKIRWLYGVAAVVCSMALWLLLPIVVHQFFPRF